MSGPGESHIMIIMHNFTQFKSAGEHGSVLVWSLPMRFPCERSLDRFPVEDFVFSFVSNNEKGKTT